MAKATTPNKNRVETTLAYMIVGVVGVSLLTIVVVLAAYAMNYRELPVLLALLPMIGLPVGALLLISLFIVQARNKAKDKR